MLIRTASLDDAAAVADIYAHHVLHGTGTFEEVPPQPEEMAARMVKVLAKDWPWLVAEGEDGTIAGYAYATQFRDRAAYRFSCENSVYVREGLRGKGIGGALLEALVAASARAGFRRMFAVIGDSANSGSIALHRRFGFHDAGLLEQAGCKFGRDLDVIFMARAL
ncbi:GNAT family N-acetyltransferase [Sphingomonas naphthae]|uniref:GNAT family N-acetyltransferase n=1 Tax=Sphingomonas naphthae TaxID=1813468 RepID=A0ABY7TRH8_9SPHN|nr:GNAT family N-acetyltransferase [Sphingomonas naphthae]WCT75281.1 GNAT family N-acetyltransferase [Sphingomonas naphthae]